MEPYVVRDGDYLLKIAYKFGFDADAIWNDPQNDDLRELRSNPNILLAGDVLYIPDQVDKPQTSFELVTGSTNNFSAPDPPTVTVTVEFVDTEDSTYASKAYTITELDQLTGLQTDAQGVVTFEAPLTLDEATLVFTDSGETWTLAIGDLNPVESLSGMFQRLQCLGHISADAKFDANDSGNNLDILRQGLESMQASSAGDSGDSDSGDSGDSDASDSSDDSGDSDDSDSSNDSDSSDASDDSDDSDDSESTDGADDSSDSQDTATTDDAVLNDDGKLDQDAADKLVDAFGC